jgi:protein associated with RNAse G/E
MSRIYTVNSRKYDGSIRRSWKCELVSRDDYRIDLVGAFEHQVEHPDLGVIEAGTVSYERFFFNRWFNYFTFEQPAGTLRNYYINICMPPEIGDDSIDYVDLDIDLIIWPDGRKEVLDTEEFEANRLEFSYPENVVNQARAELEELESLIWRSTLTSEQGLRTYLDHHGYSVRSSSNVRD